MESRKLVKAPRKGTGYTVQFYVELEGCNKFFYFPTLAEAREYAKSVLPEHGIPSILKAIEYAVIDRKGMRHRR
jgi:hypothetical protein